jgi:hypothetical protein
MSNKLFILFCLFICVFQQEKPRCSLPAEYSAEYSRYLVQYYKEHPEKMDEAVTIRPGFSFLGHDSIVNLILSNPEKETEEGTPSCLFLNNGSISDYTIVPQLSMDYGIDILRELDYPRTASVLNISLHYTSEGFMDKYCDEYSFQRDGLAGSVSSYLLCLRHKMDTVLNMNSDDLRRSLIGPIQIDDSKIRPANFFRSWWKQPWVTSRVYKTVKSGWKNSTELTKISDRVATRYNRLSSYVHENIRYYGIAKNNTYDRFDAMRPIIDRIRYHFETESMIHELYGERLRNELSQLNVSHDNHPYMISNRRRLRDLLKQVSSVSKGFLGFGLPLWTGRGPSDENIVHMDPWPFAVYIVRVSYYYLEALFCFGRAGLTPCHPCLLKLASSSGNCEYEDFRAPQTSIVEWIFGAGFDPNTIDCSAFTNTFQVILGLLRYIFSFGTQPNILWCSITNTTNLILWIIFIFLILFFSLTISLCMWCLCYFDRNRVQKNQIEEDVSIGFGITRNKLMKQTLRSDRHKNTMKESKNRITKLEILFKKLTETVIKFLSDTKRKIDPNDFDLIQKKKEGKKSTKAPTIDIKKVFEKPEREESVLDLSKMFEKQ